MSVSRVHNWISLEVLSASDINAEFNNLVNYLNGSSVTLAGATFTGDLLFTDATYDIGKSGATRPRDGFFSRNLNVAGTSTFTGNVAFGGSWGDANVTPFSMTAGHIAQITGANASNYSLITQTTAGSGTSYVQQFLFQAFTPNNTTSLFWSCDDTTTNRAQMRSNGGLANFSANNVNLSDETLKSDIELLASSAASLWNAHRDIQWSRFKFSDQTHDDWNYGYIAQDIEKHFPELVEDWDGRKAVYGEDIHNVGHAVLAQAQHEIETLKAQVAALLKRLEAAGIG